MESYSMCNKKTPKHYPRWILNMTHLTWMALRIPQYSMPGSRIRNFKVLSFTITKDITDMGFVPWYVCTPGRREQEAYPTRTSTLLDINLFNISNKNEYQTFWWTSKSSEMQCIKFIFSRTVILITQVLATMWRPFQATGTAFTYEISGRGFALYIQTVEQIKLSQRIL